MAKKSLFDLLNLSPAARQDIREILKWTEEKFGKQAATRYRTLLQQALRDIKSDPTRPGSNERREMLGGGVRTYHLSLSRSRVEKPSVKEPRHFILYRVREDGVVEVARIVHDSRELQRHIPDTYRYED